MKRQSVYQLSGRQLMLLAFVSAFIAVGAAALVYSYARHLLPDGGAGITFAESAPAGIADPSTVSDEENNIEVYKTIAPGVAFINTTSYQQDYFGGMQEGKGTGSGSIIDNN